jgi:Uma2 family endonuclease
MDIRRATSHDRIELEIERHRFSIHEVLAMQDAGVISPGDYELLDGDLCVVAAKKNDHEIVKRQLNIWLCQRLPADLTVAIEATLFLNDMSAPEPDIMLHTVGLLPEDVRGPDVALLIEIADQSLPKDLGRKARLYADSGVREYWVIEASTRRTHIHRLAADATSWAEVELAEADVPLAVPGIGASLRLCDL